MLYVSSHSAFIKQHVLWPNRHSVRVFRKLKYIDVTHLSVPGSTHLFETYPLLRPSCRTLVLCVFICRPVFVSVMLFSLLLRVPLMYRLRTVDDDECGSTGGMRIGKGNRIIRRMPEAMSVCKTTNHTCPGQGSNTGL